MTDRYHRQMLLEDIGPVGQARLGAAHAVVVGCGALGCTAADLLARAGVGWLTLIDRDLVEATNLQRQVLFDQRHADARAPKAAAAAERVGEINPGVRAHAAVVDVSSTNAESVLIDGPLGPPGVLIDGTDNFEARFLLNDVAVKHGLPYVYAGAVATRAMAMTILPGAGPCLRCLFDGPPPAGSSPTCDTVGVLGPMISMVSGIQAAETIKILVGRADLVRGSLLEFDPWQNTLRETPLGGLRVEDCPCCVGRRFEHLDHGPADPVALCGREAMQVMPPAPTRLDLGTLADRLRSHGPVEVTRYLVRGRVGGVAITVFADGRAIIEGVTDAGSARAVYARYIGS